MLVIIVIKSSEQVPVSGLKALVNKKYLSIVPPCDKKMVIPKPNLCSESQNAVREISNHTSDAGQAKRILRQFIITSLIKLRVKEQLYFLKTCIKESLTTQRIWRVTERLNLQENQARTLRKTMMKNLRKELYQKLARLTREETLKKEEVKTLLNNRRRNASEGSTRYDV